MGEIVDEIKKVNEDVDALAMDIMEQISYSEDEVSRALTPVFTKAVPYSSEELQRARNRRELGNPPGKTNSIGDQLTWEQILTRFEGKKRLWIISRDGDYGTFHKDKGLLNRFLFDELCKLTPAPEVFLFEDTATGIKHFIETTGVKADKRLTQEETKEIKEEEKSLPHWDQPYALDRLSVTPPEHTSAIIQMAKAFANATHTLGQMPKVPPATHQSPKKDQKDRQDSVPLLPPEDDNKNDGNEKDEAE